MIADQRSDEWLIAQWQIGRARDQISEILVRRHAPRVVRFFQRRGFSDDMCQDLAQEVFLRVFRGLPKFRSAATFDTWLFEIVRNVWKNAIRYSAAQSRTAQVLSLHDGDDRDLERADPGAEPALVEIAVNHGPLDHVLIEERLKHLRDAVAQMPAALQRLLICRLDLDLDVAEIAILLKVPEGTIKSQLATARDLLRKKLKRLAPDLAPSPAFASQLSGEDREHP